jgi:hypothetical protein
MIVKWVVYGYPVGKPAKKQFVTIKDKKAVLGDFKKAHIFPSYEAADFVLGSFRKDEEEKRTGMIYSAGMLTA